MELSDLVTGRKDLVKEPGDEYLDDGGDGGGDSDGDDNHLEFTLIWWTFVKILSNNLMMIMMMTVIMVKLVVILSKNLIIIMMRMTLWPAHLSMPARRKATRRRI